MMNKFGPAGDVFVRYLAGRIRESGSGAGPDCETVSPDRPRDHFFIGRLAPTKHTNEDAVENAEEFYSRLDPSSMRMRFLVRGGAGIRLMVKPRFLVYIRVFPDLRMQRDFSAAAMSAGRRSFELAPVFRRHAAVIDPVEFGISDLEAKSLETPLRWDRDRSAVLPNVFRGTAGPKVTAADLESEDSFGRFITGIGGDPRIPDIRASVIAFAHSFGTNTWEVSIALVNRSEDSDPFGIDRVIDEVLFDAGFDVDVQGGSIEPYVFPALPKSYRFDRRMLGTGVNCVIEHYPPRAPTQLRTRAMPVYEQRRFDHREAPEVPTGFAELEADGARAILENIARWMHQFDETEWDRRSKELRDDPAAGEQERSEFDADRSSFKEEIARFEAGIRCLSNPMASRAFSLTNSTFRLLGGPGRNRWYLFQIVFIVSMLPSVVGREDATVAAGDEWDITDVIWFPTGGGKTEAYLGLTVFALFFDRLRGRDAGVTALYRFPLRLLSLQQFQRIVKVVAAAEHLRRDQRIEGESFTVGHWIGSQGSPNQIDLVDADKLEEDSRRVLEDGTTALTRKYRKISECPNLGCRNREIYLRFDRSRWTLLHSCPSCGDLPVYIVDRELYRFLPSVIVGTVDKLAVLGQQRRFVNLMGWTRAFCPEHGYCPEDRCEIPGCKRRNLRERPIKDPVPTLHVQDELHLLKEDLGAFASHYETALLAMQRGIPGSRVPWKTVAATATIEEYARHIHHLYLLRGRRFPTPGPYYDRTFFAETVRNELSRLFIGINPHGYTHINAMVALLWFFHREISTLRRMSSDEFLATTGIKGLLDADAIPRFLDQYEISLAYVLTKKSGDQMAESLDTQVSTYLKEKGLPELISDVLNGGTTSDRIGEVMDRIERSDLQEPEYWKRIRSIVATSMISHGVDIDRLNFITFFGMPRLTSEYIQASSRIGRALPGIVLICFAPARERDRSHYHFFRKYHEYLDRLVEPAAINRWSKFSIDKTFPGVLIGHILNSVARRVKRKLTTEKAIYGLIPLVLNDPLLITSMGAHYGADRQASGEFTKAIDLKVRMFTQGLRPNANTFVGKRRGWKPMRSLRDTDREVKFIPSKSSAAIFEVLLGDRFRGGEVDTGTAEEESDE
jgi:helicase-like protein